MIVGKTFRFEAAHYLGTWPEDHKCHNMHGHSYKVDVLVEGAVDVHGAVTDFKNISTAFKTAVFDGLDHKVINDVLAMKDATAETLALWIFNVMALMIDDELCKVVKVRVYETEDAWAEVGVSG
jgi:6-pyruvoyltetrahydropterin/6-carboxytetrahydropterin synthase